jgi:hypothetical protein
MLYGSVCPLSRLGRFFAAWRFGGTKEFQATFMFTDSQNLFEQVGTQRGGPKHLVGVTVLFPVILTFALIVSGIHQADILPSLAGASNSLPGSILDGTDSTPLAVQRSSRMNFTVTTSG